MSRAQALVELAVCAPIVALLGLGTAAAVQVAEARDGLDAATQAAVAAAARAPDAATAAAAARSRFAGVVAAYPVRDATFAIDTGRFNRGGTVVATATAVVDVGWAGFAVPERAVELRTMATAVLDPWRSRP